MTPTLDRPEVRAVLDRLHAASKAQRLLLHPFIWKTFLEMAGGKPGSVEARSRSAKDLLLPISAEQGRFVYLVARSLQARRVVEFGTSFGVSALYLASAVRDNGGGVVIGSEIEPSKAATARHNLGEAGLADLFELREGDASQTLRDPGGPIDLLLLDGWKELYLPILEMLAPRLRPGGVVIGDNIYTFKSALAPFCAWVRDPAHGFSSVTLPLGDGTEYAVKLG